MSKMPSSSHAYRKAESPDGSGPQARYQCEANARKLVEQASSAIYHVQRWLHCCLRNGAGRSLRHQVAKRWPPLIGDWLQALVQKPCDTVYWKACANEWLLFNRGPKGRGNARTPSTVPHQLRFASVLQSIPHTPYVLGAYYVQRKRNMSNRSHSFRTPVVSAFSQSDCRGSHVVFCLPSTSSQITAAAMSRTGVWGAFFFLRSDGHTLICRFYTEFGVGVAVFGWCCVTCAAFSLTRESADVRFPMSSYRPIVAGREW